MHALALGSFDLIEGEQDGWTVETIAEGMSFGAAEPREVVIQTLLQDGDAVEIDSYGNRVLTFGILIKGADSADVAAGAAALDAEVGIPNTLSWTPPDGWGATTVFDVVTSSKSFEFDDWGEMEPTKWGRRFVLTLTCAPFGRSADETVVEAIADGEAPPTPVSDVLDDCTSTTGWAISPGNTVSLASGHLQAAATTGTTPQVMALTRTFGAPEAVTDTQYLYVDWDPSAFTTGSLRALVDMTTELTLVAAGPSDDNPGFTRVWFEALTVPISSLTFMWTRTRVTHVTAFAEVGRTNVNPFIGSGRQQFRSLLVGGSARTQGSLQISHETDALGEVLAYTNADDGSGYQPACRQYRVSGNASPTPDASTASGSFEPLDGGASVTFDIPARALPAGTYVLVARIRGTGAAITGVSWSAATRVGTTDMLTETGAKIIGTQATWTMHEVATVTLPPVALPPSSEAVVRVKLSSTNDLDLDELWLFNIDIGSYTHVSCGTAAPSAGGSSNRLWIDTATLDWPFPAIWLGTEADRSDARHAVSVTEAKATGRHVLAAGDVNLFTFTSNAENAAASLSFHKRWMDLAGA